MSSNSASQSGVAPQLDGLPEPNPFTPGEFGAWRGMLRVHATVFRELDGRLLADHGFGVDAYGVLITLVSAPGGTLTIGELGEQRNLSPSGVSRSVDRLAKIGLVERSANPADGRSLLVGLTAEGLAKRDLPDFLRKSPDGIRGLWLMSGGRWARRVTQCGRPAQGSPSGGPSEHSPKP